MKEIEALQYIVERLEKTLEHSIKEGDDCVYPHFTTSELKEQLNSLKKPCANCGAAAEWTQVCMRCLKARTIDKFIKVHVEQFRTDIEELIDAATQYLEMSSPHEDFQERARLRAATARLIGEVKND